MLANPTGKFETLITQLQTDKRYEQALSRGEKIYLIKQFKINSLTPYKISQIYHQITSKFYFKKDSNGNEPWFENELRLFIWLLMGYLYLQNNEISNMGISDWKIFSQIFNNKNPDIFQFQALSILKKQLKCQKWAEEEASLLDQIIQQKKVKNKWNEIAKDLFVLSNKTYFRTAKQCRQHWISHLDPSPLHIGWTIEEDYQLVQSVNSLGKKWSKISKKFNGKRTQHMVKNRFKSLLHFESKNTKFDEEGVAEAQIIQYLLVQLKKNIDTKLNLNLIFAEANPKQKVFQFNKQIKSAASEIFQKEKNQDNFDLDFNEQKYIQNNYDSHQNNIQLDDWCLSPKQNPDNLFLFAYPNKEKESMFEDNLRLFMNEDFKKDV